MLNVKRSKVEVKLFSKARTLNIVKSDEICGPLNGKISNCKKVVILYLPNLWQIFPPIYSSTFKRILHIRNIIGALGGSVG